MECKNCGMVNDGDAQFCVGCGQALELPAEQPVAETVMPAAEVVEEIPDELPPVKKKSRKGWWIAGISVLLAAALAVGAYFLFFRKDKTAPSALYIKDGDLYYYNLQSDMILELTDKLSTREDANLNNQILMMIQFSQDESRIFYPEKVQLPTEYGAEQELSFNLYYRDVNKKDAQPQKVASGVSYYQVSEKGDKVAYCKGNDLYISNLQEEEKIAKDLNGGFMATPDLSKIGYMNDEHNVYLWQEGKDKEKIASAVMQIVYLKDDFSVMYYVNDEGSLYKQELGKEEKEKLASDVADVCYFRSGEMYYMVEETKSLSVIDYVKDDKAEADSKMTEPDMPTAPEETEKPVKPEYNSDEEAYQVAMAEYEQAVKDWETVNAQLKEEYEKQKEAYEKEKESYTDKQARDALREQLKDKTVEQKVTSLYYFDGKDSVLVTDRLQSLYDYAQSSAVAVATIQTPGSEPEILLSQLEYIDDVDTIFQEYLQGNRQQVLVTGKTLSAEKLEEATEIRISNSGKTVYYLEAAEQATDDTTYDLYKLDVKTGKTEKYNTDVWGGWLYIPEFAEDVVYCKKYEKGENYSYTGDLYINQSQIAQEARLSVTYWDGAYYYYTDYDGEKQYGTLHRYQDGEDTVISEEVHSYCLMEGGEILYLYDYSQKRQHGTLYRYNNGKPEMIDEEVQYILPDIAFLRDYYMDMLRGG